MAEEWIVQGQGLAGGGFPALNPSALSATVEPMEDWEKVMNRGGAGRWQPVFVRLVARAADAARQAAGLFLQASPAHLRLSFSARRFLTRLQDGQEAFDPADPRLAFFLYRPEAEAYQPITLAGLACGQVERVFPAIPTAPPASAPIGAVPLGLALAPLGDTPDADAPDADAPDADALGADAPQIELGDAPLPCVTGIIDDQLGFLNARFRRTLPGTDQQVSRILRLDLMGMPQLADPSRAPDAPAPPLDLDALIADFPWEELAYAEAYPSGVQGGPLTNLADPRFRRPFSFRAAHGTHVMDLAAGFPPEAAPPDRPIFAVQLPRLSVAETWGARLQAFALQAVIRILDWADTTYLRHGTPVPVPLVLNLSLGLLAGPKDGTGFLEAEIARRLAWRDRKVPSRAVLPAGNGYRARAHAQLDLAPGETRKTLFRLQPEDLSVSFVEIWSPPEAQIDLTLTPPLGRPVSIRLEGAPMVLDGQSAGQTVVRAYLQDHPASGRRRLTLAFAPTLDPDRPGMTCAAGAWTIAACNSGKAAVRLMLDIQRDDTPSTFPAYGRQASFDGPQQEAPDPETGNCDLPEPQGSAVRREGTLSALASQDSPLVLVVGGAFGRDGLAQAALYSASGAGLPRGGPDLAAVSEESRAHPGRLAAGFQSGSAVVISGTSMAAPLVTRALVEAIAKTQAEGGELALPLATGAGRDPRLGTGVLPFAVPPGRPMRRLGD